MPMPLPINHLFGKGFQAELVFSFVIIALCLIIYFATKELFELSNHKGIKYFRLSFLFFAASIFFRSFIKLFILMFAESNFVTQELLITLIAAQVLFTYASLIAILYLIYSVFHKKFENSTGIIPFCHIFAASIAVISVISFHKEIAILIQIALAIFFAASLFLIKKKKTSLHLIYSLLAIFWVINVIDILVPNFFELFQLLIYMASITIFLVIHYKVLKTN